MENSSNGYTPEEVKRIGTGDYRCSVVAVDKTQTKESHLPMYVITVQINGSRAKVKYYLVENAYFNRNATSFFDSFGIERGDFNTLGWVGAIGAGKFVENERGYLECKWFLTRSQAEELPEWVGEKPERTTISSFFETEDDIFLK